MKKINILTTIVAALVTFTACAAFSPHTSTETFSGTSGESSDWSDFAWTWASRTEKINASFAYDISDGVVVLRMFKEEGGAISLEAGPFAVTDATNATITITSTNIPVWANYYAEIDQIITNPAPTRYRALARGTIAREYGAWDTDEMLDATTTVHIVYSYDSNNIPDWVATKTWVEAQGYITNAVTQGATNAQGSGTLTLTYSNQTVYGSIDDSAYLTNDTWSAVSNSVTTNASRGNTAYGWGDHSEEGYLTTMLGMFSSMLVSDTNYLSAELVSNGTFTGSADWWDLSNALYSANSIYCPMSQTSVLTLTNGLTSVTGAVYSITFERTTSDSDETIVMVFGDETNTFLAGASGEVTTYVAVTDASGFSLTVTPEDDSLYLDNISIKRITGGDLHVSGTIYQDHDPLAKESWITAQGYVTNGLTAGTTNLTHYYTTNQAHDAFVESTDSTYTDTVAKAGSALQSETQDLQGVVDEGNSATGDVYFATASGDNFYCFLDAGKEATNCTYNTYIGYQAGKSAINSSHNSYIGYQAGKEATNCTYNSYIGYRAGIVSPNCSYNFYGGRYAGSYSDNCDENFYAGYYAGNGADGCSRNFYGGYYSGYNADGCSRNFYGGYYSGYNTTSSEKNFYGGYESGYGAQYGIKNFYGGYKAGYESDNGVMGFYGGYNSGYDADDTTNCLFLGAYAGRNATGNNKIYIDNHTSDPGAGYDPTNDLFYYNGVDTLFLGDPSGTLHIRGSIRAEGGIDFSSSSFKLDDEGNLAANWNGGGYTISNVVLIGATGTDPMGTTVSNGLVTSIGESTLSNQVTELIVANPDSLGSELTTNGAFTGSSAGWSLSSCSFQSSGTYSNTVAISAGTTGVLTPSNAIALTKGHTYKIVYKMYVTSGTATGVVAFGGITNTTTSSATVTKTYTHRTTATNGYVLSATAPSASSLYLDELSVRDITDGDIHFVNGYVGGELVLGGEGRGTWPPSIDSSDWATHPADTDVNMDGYAVTNIEDEVYGAGWNGATEAPTKNAVYDKIETLGGGGGGGSTARIIPVDSYYLNQPTRPSIPSLTDGSADTRRYYEWDYSDVDRLDSIEVYVSAGTYSPVFSTAAFVTNALTQTNSVLIGFVNDSPVCTSAVVNLSAVTIDTYRTNGLLSVTGSVSLAMGWHELDARVDSDGGSSGYIYSRDINIDIGSAE